MKRTTIQALTGVLLASFAVEVGHGVGMMLDDDCVGDEATILICGPLGRSAIEPPNVHVPHSEYDSRPISAMSLNASGVSSLTSQSTGAGRYPYHITAAGEDVVR
jgi:hypothetical protein